MPFLHQVPLLYQQLIGGDCLVVKTVNFKNVQTHSLHHDHGSRWALSQPGGGSDCRVCHLALWLRYERHGNRSRRWLADSTNQTAGGIITEQPSLSLYFPKMNDASVQVIVIAAFGLGALEGVLSCCHIGDKFGRRDTVRHYRNGHRQNPSMQCIS